MQTWKWKSAHQYTTRTKSCAKNFIPFIPNSGKIKNTSCCHVQTWHLPVYAAGWWGLRSLELCNKPTIRNRLSICETSGDGAVSCSRNVWWPHRLVFQWAPVCMQVCGWPLKPEISGIIQVTQAQVLMQGSDYDRWVSVLAILVSHPGKTSEVKKNYHPWENHILRSLTILPQSPLPWLYAGNDENSSQGKSLSHSWFLHFEKKVMTSQSTSMLTLVFLWLSNFFINFYLLDTCLAKYHLTRFQSSYITVYVYYVSTKYFPWLVDS